MDEQMHDGAGQDRTPPAAMPLSMPPVTSDDARRESAPEVPPPVTEPIGAMPPSTPHAPGTGPETAEYPIASGIGGNEPPALPPWEPIGSWSDGPDVPQADAPSRSRRGIALFAAAALVAGGLGAGLGAAFSGGGGSDVNAIVSAPASPSSTKALSVSAIYKLVTPAVVNINTVVATPSNVGGSSQAAGTGMIVSSNGVILTNNHVIKNATKIEVSIAGHAGSYAATVLGTSATNDIALIKVNGLSSLPTVTLGDSATVQVGDTAIAIGNAQGFGGSPSSATGTISALGRTITAGDGGSFRSAETLHNLIETNANIQPGDSGGPLLNAKGQVIGIDTAASSADTAATLGFAIPINHAKTIALAIEQGKATAANGVHVGLSPFLGVFSAGGPVSDPFGGFSLGNSGNLTCSGASPTTISGASVADVIAGGPAARAGITGGDVITSVNSSAISGWPALTAAIGGLKPGAHVTIGYADGCGTAHTASVTIGGIPA
jgi:S1-C subfamily serine protease